MSYLRGVNLSGAEYGDNGATFDNQTWIYPTAAVARFIASRGHRIVRLPVKWEHLQHTPGGALDHAEVRRVKSALATMRAAGLRVIVEPHNYAQYQTRDGVTHTIGWPDGVVTIAHFVDFWKKLATTLRGNPAIHAYELMNEPNELVMPYTPDGAELTKTRGFAHALPRSVRLTNCTVTRSTKKPFSGTRSLRVVAIANGDVRVTVRRLLVTKRGYNAEAMFIAGNPRAARVCHIGVMSYNSQAEPLTYRSRSGVATPYVETAQAGYLVDDQWALCQSHFTPLAGAKWVDLRLTISGCAAGEVHYIDNVTFTPATHMTTAARSWEAITQQCVTAIRAVDPHVLVWVPIYDWQKVAEAKMNHPKGPWITSDNVAYSGHLYFDASGQGLYETAFAVDTHAIRSLGLGNAQHFALRRLKVFTDWCARGKVKGVISEMGWPWDGDDQHDWQAVGRAVYAACDRAQLDVTAWEAGANLGPKWTKLVVYDNYDGAAAPLAPARVIEAHPSRPARPRSTRPT